MTTAAARVQINVPMYLPIDGAWQVVYPGTVIDLMAGQNISLSCTIPVQAPISSTPGTLAAHGGNTSVNLRAR